MLALHPFNTVRWDAESWCDTLINFAESNDLLLICPDGGLNGKVDDQIDTAFTTALLDSMKIWYNVDTTNIYAMGFSWGARTTYTYGLSNTDVFGGFIPIGAAITRTNEVTVNLQQNSKDEAFYIIHGSLDSPTIRYTPVRDSLIAKGAIVKTNYLSGVGHTIDFSGRDSILTVGFNWIDSVNNAQLVSLPEVNANNEQKLLIFPNPIKAGKAIQFELGTNFKEQSAEIVVRQVDGKKVSNHLQTLTKGVNSVNFKGKDLSKGIYLVSIRLTKDNQTFNQEIVVE